MKWYAKVGLKRGVVLAAGAQVVSVFDGVQPTDLLVGLGVLAFMGIGVPAYASGEHIESHYMPSHRAIYLAFRDNTEAAASLAFSKGIAHHLLNEKTYLLDRGTPLIHGFIYGMGRAIGDRLSQQHDNPVYHYNSLTGFLGELKDAYLTFCEKQDKNPRGSLDKLDVPSPRSFLDKLPRFYDRFTYPWSLATATLAAAETRFGETIYREVLNEDFSFLRQ